MDDLTDEEISAFRDMAEYMSQCAQAATGVYGSGGEVPSDRQAGARANVAGWLRDNPKLREDLKGYVERARDARERFPRYAQQKAKRR